MTQGRKKEPEALKALRRGVAPVWKDTALPDPPAWLSPGALQEWRRVAPLLGEMGLLARIDMAALAGYCHCYDEVAQSAVLLDREGRIAIGCADQPRVHPICAYMEKMLASMARFMTEFGFSPSSRAKMEFDKGKAAQDGAKEEDELLDFMNGVQSPGGIAPSSVVPAGEG